MNLDKYQISNRFQQLQEKICQQLEMADGGGRFVEDLWERPEGGGGRTRVIEGRVIEKGGVNFSAVHGSMPDALAKNMNLPAGTDFFATGVSIVLHPHSPMAPIIHMNVRYFEAGNGRWWFGGGIDLTPHYVVPDDARFFHQQLKNTCDAFHPEFYEQFKNQADDYFFIKHRKETRGIGGIFYDYLDDDCGLPLQTLFEFSVAVGETFAPTYIDLLQRAKDRTWGEREQKWQLLRRGRYVEFNLVWDRGTKFGLETNGRTESILMSLPPVANWAYNYAPEPGSPEAETQTWLVKGTNWVAHGNGLMNDVT